ncbi:hypothetical protein POREN0001_0069 [Porphyromonas endodontalis ATCC 35406]|uniref:Uncharacterized protein n=1 Tax=Porphyromonas endodontalis (strain ATCC 35406 / DSM 24491 / JCM 8526 / CCUG 16442 / BCRC 14492 / NCTC 13058 / HG 370) TaxID=553175 RepID=C3JBA5_POREA|nr:hypothetical protein POREN0001_0069 [Porphyromonas endodontalis ATCC 35406]
MFCTNKIFVLISYTSRVWNQDDEKANTGWNRMVFCPSYLAP